VDTDARPDVLSVEDFVCLANSVMGCDGP
jgi:hypothetical protein